jgi:hypothetical protein
MSNVVAQFVSYQEIKHSGPMQTYIHQGATRSSAPLINYQQTEFVTFEVFMAVTMKTQSAATCSRWFLARGFLYPEDGSDTFLRNVGLQNIYTAPHPRTRHSSDKISSNFIIIT